MHTSERKAFNVKITRINNGQAVVEAHGQKNTFAIQGNDPTLGLTAPETVLGAFGLCIVSNVTKGAVEMNLKIDAVRVEFDAFKRVAPLGFEDLHYTVVIQSSESPEKLKELYHRATTNGTATNALLEGLTPKGALRME